MVCILAYGGDAMTIITPLIQHFRAGVIDKSVGKISRVVTRTTIFIGDRMLGNTIFPPRANVLEATIMARLAVIRNAGMVKIRRGSEGGIGVTNITILFRGHMIIGLDKTGTKDIAVVATLTTAVNVGMLRTQER